MKKELINIYTKRKVTFAEIAKTLSKKYNTYSIIRLISFFVGVGVMIYLFSQSVLLGIVFIFLFLFAFARFVFWHQEIQRQRIHHENLVKINENELSALDHNFLVFGAGKSFTDPMHPYSVDLDIFGDHSVFQYCNRTSTAIGEATLANYLKKPTTKKEILVRQEAIVDLTERLDWRQNFQALGMATEDSLTHIQSLKDWLKSPLLILNRQGLKLAIYILPFLVFPLFVALLYYYPWQFSLLALLPTGIILWRTKEQVDENHLQTTNVEKILAYYARLIAHIEKEHFQSEKLKNLKANFFEENKNASKQIARLSYIIQNLNVRYNVFALLLNIFGLWDLHWVYQLEKWKIAQKDNLPKWFASLEEFEAILSFSTVFYNNKMWTFPSIVEEQTLNGIALGHPLIQVEERICNDLGMPTEAHIKLVTGSNMAGKSTFLRTIGLNIVLAMAGAPVCAERFSLPLLQVYTSMRTQDALHESTSSFYAELKRLKIIIEAVDNKENIYFLLDEILKGTNSNDRHTGSKALIKQFIKSKGAGIIATHDLDLGKLEATSNGAIENLCIEVEVKKGKLFFDYKLKKGVSQSFNATLLMKNMGIRIEED